MFKSVTSSHPNLRIIRQLPEQILLSWWQTNDKIGQFCRPILSDDKSADFCMSHDRFYRPILSADISVRNLAVELVLISPRKSGDIIIRLSLALVGQMEVTDPKLSQLHSLLPFFINSSCNKLAHVMPTGTFKQHGAPIHWNSPTQNLHSQPSDKCWKLHCLTPLIGSLFRDGVQMCKLGLEVNTDNDK